MKFVTRGLYSKVLNPILRVRHGSDSRIDSRFAVAQAVDCASGINSNPDPACPQEAKVLEEKFGNECREYNGEARQTFPSLLRRCKLRSSTTTRCALYQGVSVSETKTWIVARLGCSF